MQKKSSAQHKAVNDAQRSAAAQIVVRAPREAKPVAAAAASGRNSGETTLGGHVDRGLTLAALYDTGVLGRLRLEVRIRLLSDLAQSLAWLHANPRLMAAHAHLVIAPSTIVIGLDGVARVDVRAAKKQESERNPSEADYVAPELLAGGTADRRADVYSLGVLAWEALAGKRISSPDAWVGRGVPQLPEDAAPISSDVPAALGGGQEREPLRRKPPAARPLPKTSHSRLRIPPPVMLPEQGEWAKGLAALALQAMGADPDDRPQDCHPFLLELERIVAHLAAAHEIAEVVQGISDVETLCVPPPTLPDADAACQSLANGTVGFMDRNPCGQALAPTCAQRPRALTQHVVEPPAPPPATPLPAVVAAPVAAEPEPPSCVKQPRDVVPLTSNTAWFVVAGLLALAVLGLLAGYAASTLAVR
ncbi:MAG TPA: protein kinase [Polyangiaceae bacterium]|nr:protein kinase [Polyangiaceae bacterium]